MTKLADTPDRSERLTNNINGQDDRFERWLDAIYDAVDFEMNPEQEECWNCGGEGETYDCIDGCCVDAESGCPDCARACVECRLYAARRKKAVRDEVIRLGNIDLAIVWLKQDGRWHDSFTRERVQAELTKAAFPTAPEAGR